VGDSRQKLTKTGLRLQERAWDKPRRALRGLSVGLVFKAHRLSVSLNSRLESNKEKEERQCQSGFGREVVFIGAVPGDELTEVVLVCPIPIRLRVFQYGVGSPYGVGSSFTGILGSHTQHENAGALYLHVGL